MKKKLIALFALMTIFGFTATGCSKSNDMSKDNKDKTAMTNDMKKDNKDMKKDDKNMEKDDKNMEKDDMNMDKKDKPGHMDHDMDKDEKHGDMAKDDKHDDADHDHGHADAHTSASNRGNTAEALQAGMAADGAWVFGLTSDIESDQDLMIEGDFFFGDRESEGPGRKIGLFEGSFKEPTGLYNLTVPNIHAYSEGLRIYGAQIDGKKATVHGNLYVYANGLTLKNVDIDGNIIFASQEFMDSATYENSKVMGEISVAQ